MTQGLIATKVGMSQHFDENGKCVAVTLLKVEDNFVIENKTGKVVLGSIPAKKLNKPKTKFFEKQNLPLVRCVKEFKSTENYDVGHALDLSLFQDTKFVDVTSYTKGRGFTGVVKRWRFGGMRASHGVSLGERCHGSTGHRQDPGRVFKNKKMAGQYGDEKCTIQNIKIVEILPEEKLILIKGGVPGPKGSVVYLKKAIKKVN